MMPGEKEDLYLTLCDGRNGVVMRVPNDYLALTYDEFSKRYVEPAFAQLRLEAEAAGELGAPSQANGQCPSSGSYSAQNS